MLRSQTAQACAPEARCRLNRNIAQEVLNIVGATSGAGPRIITFGQAQAQHADELVRLMRRLLDSTASPRSRSPSASPRADGRVSPRQIDDHAAGAAPPASLPRALEARLAQLSVPGQESREMEAVRSVQLSRVSNAVAVAAGSLPPEVIRGLSEDSAMPFLFFRRLSVCYIEVRVA